MGLIGSVPNRPVGSDPRDIAEILEDFDFITAEFDGGISRENLTDLEVVESKIGPKAVTNGKLGDAAVDARVIGILPATRVYRSTSQNIPYNVLTAASFDSERWDTDGIHDPATNPTRLTCKTSGLYLVKSQVSWAGVTGADLTADLDERILLNGAKTIAFNATGNTGTVIPGPLRRQISAVVAMVVNDYVELHLFHKTEVPSGTPASRNVLGSDNVNNWYGLDFSMSFLGKVA